MNTQALILVAFLPLGAAFGQSQKYDAVSGVVQIANRPVSGATVFTRLGRSFRSTRTDSAGRFHLDSLPPGQVLLEVICPGDRNRLGSHAPTLFQESVTVGSMALRIRQPAGACLPRAPFSARVHWQGWFGEGFEESFFTPCALDSLADLVRSFGSPFGRQVWVRVADSAWRSSDAGPLKMNAERTRASGFVEWAGVLNGPAPSGHLGVSYWELVVDSVFSVQEKGQCPAAKRSN